MENKSEKVNYTITITLKNNTDKLLLPELFNGHRNINLVNCGIPDGVEIDIILRDEQGAEHNITYRDFLNSTLSMPMKITELSYTNDKQVVFIKRHSSAEKDVLNGFMSIFIILEPKQEFKIKFKIIHISITMGVGLNCIKK